MKLVKQHSKFLKKTGALIALCGVSFVTGLSVRKDVDVSKFPPQLQQVIKEKSDKTITDIKKADHLVKSGNISEGLSEFKLAVLSLKEWEHFDSSLKKDLVKYDEFIQGITYITRADEELANAENAMEAALANEHDARFVRPCIQRFFISNGMGSDLGRLHSMRVRSSNSHFRKLAKETLITYTMYQLERFGVWREKCENSNYDADLKRAFLADFDRLIRSCQETLAHYEHMSE